MKKLTQYQKDRNTRRIFRAYGIRRRRRNKNSDPGIVKVVKLPVNFSLRDNYEDSMKSINLIREIVINERNRVFIDFSQIKKIGNACAMVLTAEMYRCKYMRPGRGFKVINGNYPHEEEVYKKLYFMNFFRLFQIDEIVDFDDPKDSFGNYHFMMQLFSRVEADTIAVFRDAFVATFDGLDTKAKRRMQGAISEALLNSFNHAFSREADFQVQGRRAWLCGYANPERKEIGFMILDQGAGIPRTLTQFKIEAILAVIPGLGFDSDGKRIFAATQLGRTSTAQQGRGKGFKSMKAFIDACEDAELQIFSNRGRYRFSKQTEAYEADSEESIGGTLVVLRARHTESDFELTG